MLKLGLRWSATSLLCVVLAGCLATGTGGGWQVYPARMPGLPWPRMRA